MLLSSCSKHDQTDGGTTSVGDPIGDPSPLSLATCQKLFEDKYIDKITNLDLTFAAAGNSEKFCKIDEAIVLFETIQKKYQPTPLAITYFLTSSSLISSNNKKLDDNSYCQSLGGEVVVYLSPDTKYIICTFSDNSALEVNTLRQGSEKHKLLAQNLMSFY